MHNSAMGIVNKYSLSLVEPILPVLEKQEVILESDHAFEEPVLIVDHGHDAVLHKGDVMPMAEVVIVRAYGRGAIVVDNQAFPIAVEGFHAAHVHRILIMAEVKFVLHLAVC